MLPLILTIAGIFTVILSLRIINSCKTKAETKTAQINLAYTEDAPYRAVFFKTRQRMNEIIREANTTCNTFEEDYRDGMEWTPNMHSEYDAASSRASIAFWVRSTLDDDNLFSAQKVNEIVRIYHLVVSRDGTASEIQVALEAKQLIRP